MGRPESQEGSADESGGNNRGTNVALDLTWIIEVDLDVACLGAPINHPREGTPWQATMLTEGVGRVRQANTLGHLCVKTRTINTQCNIW